MILVRDIFQLKFGKAKDAIASAKQFKTLAEKVGHKGKVRFMTDLTGRFYTLVMETTYDSMGAYESFLKQAQGTEDFSTWYKGFVPFVESGSRELYTVVE